MGDGLSLAKLDFFSNTHKVRKNDILVSMLLITIIIASATMIAFANEQNIPMTGFTEFDAMYQHHMDMDQPLVDDIMVPVNNVIFFLIKLQLRILGSVLLLLSISSMAFAIWYVLKPEFADEVSEVKAMVAAGQVIPIDDPKQFFMQFCPDIKANSGIADRYEFERPTMGMLVRDHLIKFVMIFAVAISLMTNVITTFTVKAGNAVAYGAKYYTDSTDFVGMVRTATTAGKDFDPRYDKLSTSGKNKAKVFNAVYNTLKDLEPRDRTEGFLNAIGTATYNYVTELESASGEGANAKVDFNAANFSASAESSPHQVNPDKSTVKIVIAENASRFGIMQDQYIYLTVLQYDDVRGDSPYSQGVTTYAEAWGTGTPPGGFHTSKTSYAQKMKNNGYTLEVKKTPGQVRIEVLYNDNSKKEFQLKHGDGVKINASTNNQWMGVDVKQSGKAVQRMTIYGVNNYAQYRKDKDIKPVLDRESLTWNLPIDKSHKVEKDK